MGKKKDKRKAHAQEGKAAGAAPLAGIAATLVRQLDTPAGRQVIAAGLMAAASAISGKGAGKDAWTGGARPAGPVPPTPPAPPEPPIPPKSADVGADAGPSAGTGPFAGDTPEPPRGAGPAWPPNMAPEMAKVIGTVTAGLERWAAGFVVPKPPETPKS